MKHIFFPEYYHLQEHITKQPCKASDLMTFVAELSDCQGMKTAKTQISET